MKPKDRYDKWTEEIQKVNAKLQKIRIALEGVPTISCHYAKLQSQKRYYKDRRRKLSLRKDNARKLITKPWTRFLRHARKRCTYSGDHSYARYGGRGIRCLLTPAEIKELWLRDRAFALEEPSLDRIDSNGDYCFENCRFLEKTLNVFLGHQERKEAKLKLKYPSTWDL